MERENQHLGVQKPYETQLKFRADLAAFFLDLACTEFYIPATLLLHGPYRLPQAKLRTCGAQFRGAKAQENPRFSLRLLRKELLT